LAQVVLGALQFLEAMVQILFSVLLLLQVVAAADMLIAAAMAALVVVEVICMLAELELLDKVMVGALAYQLTNTPVVAVVALGLLVLTQLA
jgi:hypothetical protein